MKLLPSTLRVARNKENVKEDVLAGFSVQEICRRRNLSKSTVYRMIAEWSKEAELEDKKD